MKLSSKEMIILAVFLAIVIMVAGTFLFILPEYEKIEPNQKSLDSVKEERDNIYASLAREATIDQEIQDAIDQANTISLYFYDDMTTYEADVIVREILEETNMSTKSLSIGSFSTSTLSVSDYVETIVSYPLKDYSGFAPGILNVGDFPVQYDENGKIIIPEAYIEKYGEEQALTEYLTALLSSQSQTIGAITVNFTVEGTRGDFLNFLNYVAGLERATHINSTTVIYTGSSADTNNTPPAEGEEGEEAAPPANNNNNNQQAVSSSTKISAPITMTLYCITPMVPQEETTTTEAEAEPAA